MTTARNWLWTIVAVGAALRLVPIWFGLPYLLARPDEGAAIGHAIAVLAGDPNPHFFHWPSLTFYVFAAVLWIAGTVHGLFAGGMTALTDVQQVVVTRAFVALAGTGTLVVLYRLARRLADETTALLAAAFLAVAILHVRESHFAMTDAIMTLLATSSLALMLRGLDRAGASADLRAVPLVDFALAGLCGGLAASTKYSAAVVAAGMGVAQLVLLAQFRRSFAPRAWLPSVVFGAALIAGFLVATPYALLDYPTFSADLRFDFTHLSGGHGINLGRGWIYHLIRSLPYGAGPLTFIAGAIGLVVSARRYPRPTLVLTAYAGALYASVGSGYTVFFRYVLPIVPVICLFAAIAVRQLAPMIAARTRMAPATAVGVVAGVIAAPSLVNCVWFDALLAKTDTRVLAAAWLAPRVKPGETLHDSGGDYATLDLGRTAYHVWRYDPAANSFGHPDGLTPDWLVLHQSPLRTYGNHSAGLRRLASERYELVYEIRATQGAASSAVYDLQDAFFMPISGFHTVIRPGPTVLVYRKR